jgi:hypothetical protein
MGWADDPDRTLFSKRSGYSRFVPAGIPVDRRRGDAEAVGDSGHADVGIGWLASTCRLSWMRLTTPRSSSQDAPPATDDLYPGRHARGPTSAAYRAAILVLCPISVIARQQPNATKRAKFFSASLRGPAKVA